MRTLKLYIDTSVIGGYFDQELAEETKALFEKVEQNEYSIVLSDLTERELLVVPKM
jgi:predicted nucleic acid-binding protein